MATYTQSLNFVPSLWHAYWRSKCTINISKLFHTTLQYYWSWDTQTWYMEI